MFYKYEKDCVRLSGVSLLISLLFYEQKYENVLNSSH